MAIEKKIKNILNFSSQERYDYFIRKAVDFEKVWGLYNNGWATSKFNEDYVIPFWPEKIFAELCANNEWEGYTPKFLSLKVFMEKWIIGMQHDSYGALIFPIPNGQGILVPLHILKEDLLNEQEQYE